MQLEIVGDVAVVVGGARGLGRAIADAFASEGARVSVIDRESESAYVADVTDFEAVRAAASAIRKDFGRCDHLVFAAGVGSGQFGFPFWNVDPATWDRVLRVNLIGAAHAAQAFAPSMAEARTGTILFLASVAGQIGSQSDPPYSASKAGLINFAQCAAKDLAPYGVRVNTLCPGMIRSALNRSVFESWAARQPDEGRPSYEQWGDEKVRALVPLGRWQTPEDVAAMAVFLSSPRSGNVTGQTINVDGGYVMHW
jgi:2-hydroxycyclohexanecarboxyl-CoA dehydrogenase